MSTYVLSAVSAAIAGTLLTANVNSAKYDLGSGYTLAIITAVVLGGTLNTGGKGSIIGKNPMDKGFAVSKDNGDIDGITASTITSRAFLKAVRQASEATK